MYERLIEECAKYYITVVKIDDVDYCMTYPNGYSQLVGISGRHYIVEHKLKKCSILKRETDVEKVVSLFVQTVASLPIKSN